MNWSWITTNYLTRGFWGDEAWTAGISRLPISEIIAITGQDFHPPFYYFIVHFFGAPSGFAEVPVRLISVFFFLLTAVGAFHLVKLFWQSKNSSKSYLTSSYMTSILVLLSPILLTYAMEARSYALLAFESVLSAYIFWRAKDEKKGKYTWRLLYLALGAVMVYTHYYAWFILASHAFYLLLFEHKRLLPMLPAAFGILLAQLPWLPTLFGQTSSVKGSYWIGPINSMTHLEFLWRVAGGDVTTVWQKPLAYTISAIILLDLAYILIRKLSGRNHVFALSHKFLLTWLIIPTLLPTIVSLVFTPVFFYRYLIFSAIPLLILTVQALRSLPRPLFLVITALILYGEVMVSWVIFNNYPRSMREATIELYEQKEPGTAPVYTVLPAFAEVMYYASPYDTIIVSPEGLVQFSGKSLLDKYVELGLTTIKEPPTDTPYYFLTPEKTIEYITP